MDDNEKKAKTPKKSTIIAGLAITFVIMFAASIVGGIIGGIIYNLALNYANNCNEPYYPEYQFDPNPMCDKPVIYIYPEEETAVRVKLDLDGELTCTYPKYDNGWEVLAKPDGTLLDTETNKEYNYLYWEGISDVKVDETIGYCVKGTDTAEFLETKLNELGLSRKEANEFIVYWLPQMEVNEYNYISFDTEDYENRAELSITPAPDNVIRVFMTWKALDEPVELTEPLIDTPVRDGFTVVEWGGTQIKG